MKYLIRFIFTCLLSTFYLFASCQNLEGLPKHAMGFHIGTNLDIPFYLYYSPNTVHIPVRYYPTLDIETGVTFKSRLTKRLKINYGFLFRYYSFAEKYIGSSNINQNSEPNFVQSKLTFSGYGAFNFPIRLNVYGKKLKNYFICGLDLSIPLFRYNSEKNSYTGSNVYVVPARYLKYEINAPITLGMGFDIQKKKIALSIEPNMQLCNFIGYYPSGSLGRKVMISFGLNVIGMKTLSR